MFSEGRFQTGTILLFHITATTACAQASPVNLEEYSNQAEEE